MEYIISAFWSLLELISYHYFLRAFLTVKTSKNLYIFSFTCAWLFPIIYALICLDSNYQQPISFVILIVISIINYGGTSLQKLLLVILVYIFGAIFDTAFLYGTCSLLGVSLADLVWRKITYTLAVSIGKMIMMFLFWTIFHVRQKRKSESLQRKWLMLTILFPIVSLVMLFVVFHGYRDQEDLSIGSVIFSAFLALANTAIIYLIQIMEKSTTEAKNLALLNQQMEIQTSSILALERNYRAQRKATHEFHNQLQTIRSLITAGDYGYAENYIQQLQGAHPIRIVSINSHHPIIDAVLNHKYQLANDNNIDVRIQVNDLSSVSVGTDYLVVLLSNLLDNAIEACLRYDGERIIQCNILKSDSLYLSIRNTSLPIQIKDNYIPTSKADKYEHGYGLAHVDLILHQLHAEYIISYDDGWFEFATEIPQLN